MARRWLGNSVVLFAIARLLSGASGTGDDEHGWQDQSDPKPVSLYVPGNARCRSDLFRTRGKIAEALASPRCVSFFRGLFVRFLLNHASRFAGSSKVDGAGVLCLGKYFRRVFNQCVLECAG